MGWTLARELLAVQSNDDALVASAERLGVCIPEGLSSWFGPFGALALISRTLASAQAAHPALRALSVTTRAVARLPALAGISESAREHGTREMADGILEWIASLYDLIARLIGEDLARTLLTQCAAGHSADGTPTVNEQ